MTNLITMAAAFTGVTTETEQFGASSHPFSPCTTATNSTLLLCLPNFLSTCTNRARTKNWKHNNKKLTGKFLNYRASSRACVAGWDERAGIQWQYLNVCAIQIKLERRESEAKFLTFNERCVSIVTFIILCPDTCGGRQMRVVVATNTLIHSTYTHVLHMTH